MNSVTNTIGFRGRFILEARDIETGEIIFARVLKNTITEASRTVRNAMLLGNTASATVRAMDGQEYPFDIDMFRIRGIAFGSGTQTPSVQDYALQNEIGRKEITDIKLIEMSGKQVVETVCSLAASEFNTASIEEIGVICSAGTLTDETKPDILLSRITVHIEKNDRMTLNIIRTDICEI